MSVASGERSPDGVGEQPGQHVFTAEQHLPLIGEVPEERGAVQTGAIRDLRDGRFLVAVLHEQVQRGVSRRSRAFGAHLLTVTA